MLSSFALVPQAPIPKGQYKDKSGDAAHTVSYITGEESWNLRTVNILKELQAKISHLFPREIILIILDSKEICPLLLWKYHFYLLRLLAMQISFKRGP